MCQILSKTLYRYISTPDEKLYLVTFLGSSDLKSFIFLSLPLDPLPPQQLEGLLMADALRELDNPPYIMEIAGEAEADPNDP
jgi:hypothetical protein